MSLSIHRSALVMHSSEQMFTLVNDVVSYPEFLPWCASATLLEDDGRSMVARLDVSKGAVRQSFTTRNHYAEPGKIAMRLVEGPFSRLNGEWRFIALDESASKVELLLEFDLKKSISKMAFGPIFNQAANSMVDAFCMRAKSVYGSGK
ncbi:MAG: ubiquinone-binding protein [Oleiphilus sp.]|nr:MAG: ubiquinone-binding protein [Oleiphilus sp.]